MAELNLGVQDALDWIGRFHEELANDFLADCARVPSFLVESEAVKHEIRLYVDALGNWVRANYQWSFEVWYLTSNDAATVANILSKEPTLFWKQWSTCSEGEKGHITAKKGCSLFESIGMNQ